MEARSPVHVKRSEYVVDGHYVETEVHSWFPITQEGILIAIEELDSAHQQAREQLVGMITRNT